MALSIDQLTAITERYIAPTLHDNIFDSNPLLKKLLNSGQYKGLSGGTVIDAPLAYASTTASGWYEGVETLDTSENDQMTAARYQWKNAFAGITLSEEDRLKNGGDAAVLKLLQSKAMLAEKTLKDNLGTGLYSDGTNAKSIVGLRDVVATDQNVGQISQATNSWWQANVDSTTTTLTIGAVNAQFDNATVDSEQPDIILSTRSNYQRYYNLLQPQQRFTDGETAKGGWSNLMFNGKPWISDSHCPTAHIFGLNLKALCLWYHKERDFKTMPFQKPDNQEVMISRILWMGAFGSTNNRYHFKLSAITA